MPVFVIASPLADLQLEDAAVSCRLSHSCPPDKGGDNKLIKRMHGTSPLVVEFDDLDMCEVRAWKGTLNRIIHLSGHLVFASRYQLSYDAKRKSRQVFSRDLSIPRLAKSCLY